MAFYNGVLLCSMQATGLLCLSESFSEAAGGGVERRAQRISCTRISKRSVSNGLGHIGYYVKAFGGGVLLGLAKRLIDTFVISRMKRISLFS